MSMKDYRIEREGSSVIIWDDDLGVGLSFQEGVGMQRYLSGVCLKDRKLYESEEGLETVGKCVDRLTAFASEKWPMEFEEIPNL